MLKLIVSSIVCSLAAVLGTGLRGCDFSPENLESIALLPAGTTIEGTSAYDRAVVRGLQKAGKWIVLNQIYSFEWQTADDEVETSDSKGTEAVSRRGLYKLELMFRSGLYFQKVLSSLEGNGRWDVIMFDQDGNQLHVDKPDGAIGGFSTGRFSVSPMAFKSGTNSFKTRLTIQFTKTAQFNDGIGFIGQSQMPFNPDDIEGINQVRLAVPTSPASAATTVVVRTVFDKDGSTFVTGLGVGNFIVTKSGATQAISAVTANAVNKTYTLTIPAVSTGDVLLIGLYDTTNSEFVVSVGTAPDDILLQAKDVSTVVVV